MSTNHTTPAEPKEKKPRKPRTVSPFMLAIKEEKGLFSTVLPLLPENSFLTRAAAIKAAKTIADFCDENEVHIIQVSPKITVTTKTHTTLKVGK